METLSHISDRTLMICYTFFFIPLFHQKTTYFLFFFSFQAQSTGELEYADSIFAEE